MVLLAGMLLVVPLNMHYSRDLRKLKQESDAIVHWVYQQKLKTNAFPEIIGKHDPRITYMADGENGFSLYFYVATPTTGHFYTPKDGWGYMDD